MKAKLYLENGTIFEGESFGALGTLYAEVVFNTGMTGYEEILTDPSYKGQVVMMTYPIIGSYGINQIDVESSNVQVFGFVVKECVTTPSHWQSTISLDSYLKQNNIPGLSGIDTRKLAKIIRENGSMNCLLTTEKVTDSMLEKLKIYKMPLNLVEQVSSNEITVISGEGLKVGVIDLGLKKGIVRQLENLECAITIFPHNTTKEVILKHDIDVLLFSNGPGDPKDAHEAIDLGKNLVGEIPLWGICLGHQILALVIGADTYKMKFGHRGANHPVIHLPSNKVHMSSQNHGYAVEESSLPETVSVTYRNVNDNTVEGIESDKLNIVSVQFHPEEGPGPEDSHYIFEQWVKQVENSKKDGGVNA